MNVTLLNTSEYRFCFRVAYFFGYAYLVVERVFKALQSEFLNSLSFMRK